MLRKISLVAAVAEVKSEGLDPWLGATLSPAVLRADADASLIHNALGSLLLTRISHQPGKCRTSRLTYA